MRFIVFAFSFFLASCSNLTVYKLGVKTDADMHYEFIKSDFLVIESSAEKDGYDSEIIKAKIISHLNSIGYKSCSKLSGVLPRYTIIFDWKTDINIKESILPIYVPGTTLYTSGSGHSSSGEHYSYSGSSTKSGEISYIPYKYNEYNSSLTIMVGDTLASLAEDKITQIVWTARTFFSGDQARHIDQAVDYLIPAIFDRFGKPIEGRAEKYQFSGQEEEVYFLKNLNKPEEFVKRQLASNTKSSSKK